MKLEKEGKLIQIQREEFGCNEKFFGVRIENKISEKDWEILKKCIFQKVKLTLEIEEPILDEVERKYLSGVIRPFRDRVKNIQKYEMYPKGKRIIISLKDNQDILLPTLKKGTMYKGMELNKGYTLEELGL